MRYNSNDDRQLRAALCAVSTCCTVLLGCTASTYFCAVQLREAFTASESRPLLILTSVLFSYVKHLLLLSLILGASIKVTNESKTTFGAVVDTGYLADNADYIFERFCVWPE